MLTHFAQNDKSAVIARFANLKHAFTHHYQAKHENTSNRHCEQGVSLAWQSINLRFTLYLWILLCAIMHSQHIFCYTKSHFALAATLAMTARLTALALWLAYDDELRVKFAVVICFFVACHACKARKGKFMRFSHKAKSKAFLKKACFKKRFKRI